MSVEYLNAAVGAVLTEALAEVMQRRPPDAIQFIVDFIRNYQVKESKKAEMEDAARRLQTEKEAWQRELAERERLRAEREKKRAQDELQVMTAEDKFAVAVRADEALRRAGPPPVTDAAEEDEEEESSDATDD